jgi:hypothetical protein
MNERDLRRIEVLTEVLSGQRTIASAAVLLSVSGRQINRLLRKFREADHVSGSLETCAGDHVSIEFRFWAQVILVISIFVGWFKVEWNPLSRGISNVEIKVRLFVAFGVLLPPQYQQKGRKLSSRYMHRGPALNGAADIAWFRSNSAVTFPGTVCSSMRIRQTRSVRIPTRPPISGPSALNGSSEQPW